MCPEAGVISDGVGRGLRALSGGGTHSASKAGGLKGQCGDL